MRILFLILLQSTFLLNAQLLQNKTEFTKQDSLRGSITPERAWWDVTYYHLDIEVKPDKKYISGSNTIHYRVLTPHQLLQIDLQDPLNIEYVIQNGDTLKVNRNGAAHFVELKTKQKIGSINALKVFYKGYPKEAKRAPWDGGLSWKKDKNNNHFVATSCQGLGASVWWPNKDHPYDEPDSMLISVTNPKKLVNISNGRLRKLTDNKNGTVTSQWFVSNPINNYGVNLNIGDYVNFSEVYQGEKGALDMDYWVLSYNLDKAKTHFKDAPKMMKAFEHWFGPYPFYEDSFKLVEVPYLGMEHQSSVTYGNNFRKGYLGRDLSNTGWGLKFDFIIIHEAGHEWFANNITYNDAADMWIHEGFTNYSECLFLEYYYGEKAGQDYVIGLRRNIKNDKPIIGQYQVNNEGSSDMYYKGANMLHTLRQWINDDDLWRKILRGLNKDFYHQTVSSVQIEKYISDKTGLKLEAFFNQYLRDVRVPTLEVSLNGKQLKYRWTNVVEGFEMPLRVKFGNEWQWIYPKANWQSLQKNSKKEAVEIDKNFYIKVKKL